MTSDISNLNNFLFQNGILSALPHLWTMLAGQIFGFIADLLITKEVMPINFVRKVMHSFGFLGPAIGLALLGYVVDDWQISVAIMAIGYGFRGATYSGHTQVLERCENLSFFSPIICQNFLLTESFGFDTDFLWNRLWTL